MGVEWSKDLKTELNPTRYDEEQCADTMTLFLFWQVLKQPT